MKKIVAIIIAGVLALGMLFLTGCGATLDDATTDGMSLGETVESGLDEVLTDMSDVLTDSPSESESAGESSTADNMPEDTTVEGETDTTAG